MGSRSLVVQDAVGARNKCSTRRIKYLGIRPRLGANRVLDQVRDVIRRSRYSIRTEQAYVDWIRRFILFQGKRRTAQIGP